MVRTGAITEFEENVATMIGNEMIGPIRETSEWRKMLPGSQDINLLTQEVTWDELIDKPGFGFLPDPVYNYSTRTRFKTVAQNVGVIFTEMGFTRNQWKRIQSASKWDFQTRAAVVAENLVEWEDAVAIIGGASGSVMDGYDGVTDSGNFTAGTGTASVTTMANGIATLTGLLDDLDDNYNYGISGREMVVVLTRDVYKKARSVENTNTDSNLLKRMSDLLKEWTNESSMIMPSRYYSGSYTVDAMGDITVTAGTTGSGIILKDKSVFDVKNTGVSPNLDLIHTEGGYRQGWEQRLTRINKRHKASGHIYLASTAVS